MVKVAVVDVETTGLDQARDELIALSLTCVEIDIASGELVKVIDRYTGQREPTRPMSAAVERIVGIPASDLARKTLDLGLIAKMLEGCALVVAHNAAFDRSFAVPYVPVFGQLAWSCSLKDIDWLGSEQQQKASIDHLLVLYGLKASNGTTKADCEALVQVLGRPLPVSGLTGFEAILASARLARYRFSVPDVGTESGAALAALGFEFDPNANAWSAIAGGVNASKLESTIVDMAVFDGRFERFSVELLVTHHKN